MSVRSADREALRGLYVFRCGYCGVSETDAGTHFTVDHFQPVAKGGLDDLSNLVYCCHTCNEFKGDWWKPDGERRILHPLEDILPDHIAAQDDGTVLGITPTGIFHVARLHLNRVPLVAHRIERIITAGNTSREKDVLNRMTRLEERVERLQSEVEQLRRR